MPEQPWDAVEVSKGSGRSTVSRGGSFRSSLYLGPYGRRAAEGPCHLSAQEGLTVTRRQSIAMSNGAWKAG